jgi:hypothetical protein
MTFSRSYNMIHPYPNPNPDPDFGELIGEKEKEQEHRITIHSAPKIPQLHRTVTSDMFQSVLSFLSDEDLMELVHIDKTFLRSIRKTKRNIFQHACSTCYHPMKHCKCIKRDRCISYFYFLFLVGLCVFCFTYPFQSH